MRRVSEYYGHPATRAGYIRCPFHREDTPSCKLYEHSFYCFGCGAGGDVIDFVMRLFNLRFAQAVEMLTRDFGISSIKPAVKPKPTPPKQIIWQNNIDSLCIEHRRLWHNYIHCAPSSPDEAPCQDFIEALQRLEYIEYLIEEAAKHG